MGEAINKENIESQVVTIQAILDKENAELELISEQYKKIAQDKKSKEARIKELKDQISALINKNDKTQINGYSYFWKKSTAVKIIDQNLLPMQYIKTKVTHDPDKTIIKADLSRDITIPGAELTTNYAFQILKLKQ